MSNHRFPATSQHLTDLRSWFDEFVTRHRQDTVAEQRNIDLKHGHSYRVFQEATAICDALQLPDAQRLLAQSGALLHDVGRFPQYNRYKTFSDPDSLNHARLGVATLREHTVLAKTGFSVGQSRDVLLAVLLHNRKELPSRLSAWHSRLCSIVRDADKLDIFSVMLEHLERPQSDQSPTLTLGLQPDPTRYSPALVSQVAAGRLVDYRHLVWVNDFKLLLASWVSNFAFPVSRQRLRDSGLLGRLLAMLPDTQECADLAQSFADPPLRS
ncbi:MAG: HD domain-containing protein [Thermodesulfobacteriota bacterium]